MSRPQATPNKHKTDWPMVVVGLALIMVIGMSVMAGAA